MRILSLFSRRRIAHLLPNTFPKVLDSRRFRMVEICRQYTLDARGSAADLLPPFVKAVMHPDSVGSDLGQRSVYSLDEFARLGCWNYGDDNWSLDDGGYSYSDIAVYEGKVWVVDHAGKLSQMHTSLEHRSFSLPFYQTDGRRRKCHGSSKHLAVSGDDLYLADRFFGGYGDGFQTAFFIVYRLDQRRGRWEEVRSLGNSAFFICNRDSFVVSARELGGRGANCIYHAENQYSKFDVYDVATQRLRWPDKSDFLIGLSCSDDAGR
ncbi:hypothetical protein EUGRSUZ_B01412 [Eucalyptus grandis]|uniref:KIB1-4 beta-propeller domain-containing protein n=2 Tax=Eucalyptus grandis TaxID=71139 RepID=A0A059D1V3_EUCGR|nr:hypothetical protein EUGRSUZ_B01412 [Eucalyptus grandis]